MTYEVLATGDRHFLMAQREQASLGLLCRKPLISQQICLSRSARLNLTLEIARDTTSSRCLPTGWFSFTGRGGSSNDQKI
jgi:hypothetical protein